MKKIVALVAALVALTLGSATALGARPTMRSGGSPVRWPSHVQWFCFFGFGGQPGGCVTLVVPDR